MAPDSVHASAKYKGQQQIPFGNDRKKSKATATAGLSAALRFAQGDGVFLI